MMTADFRNRRRRAQSLVKKLHAGQFRTKGHMPAWHHVDRVSRLLEQLLDEYGESTPAARQDIIIAALGHDAIEDSTVERSQLIGIFGEHGLKLIEGMTNRQGDDHHAAYIRQVRAAEEGVKLIKLADTIDNCDSVTMTLGIMGNQWLNSYFLPIIRPMIGMLAKTKFRTYRRTGAELLRRAIASYQFLLEERERFRQDQKNRPAD